MHSYGYDSDWTKSQQSSLTIHDFGQALLADLYNSPNLKKNGNVSGREEVQLTPGRPANHRLMLQTPIVLVAHSMGGLVVKKVSP